MLTYLAWGVGLYFAIGILVALLFLVLTSYGEGEWTFEWGDIGYYVYIALIWPAYFCFAVAMWLSSK